MKKAFSLIEVIISVVILSVVMITLLQVKNDNIHLVSKSDEKVKVNDYVLLAVNFNSEIKDKNEEINLDKNYVFENEELKQELKDKKIIIKDEKTKTEDTNNHFNSLNITTFSRTFTLDKTDIKKKLYSFKIEL